MGGQLPVPVEICGLLAGRSARNRGSAWRDRDPHPTVAGSTHARGHRFSQFGAPPPLTNCACSPSAASSGPTAKHSNAATRSGAEASSCSILFPPAAPPRMRNAGSCFPLSSKPRASRPSFPENALLLTPSIRDEADAAMRLYLGLKAINARLGCQFFEGVVMKRGNAPYPVQLRSDSEECRTWIKHRFVS